MKILGVDPGIHGGLAIVAIDNATAPQLVDAIDIPVAALAPRSASMSSPCVLGSPPISRSTR